MAKESIKMEVSTRTKEESPKELVRNGMVPAVLYGAHLKENAIFKIAHNTIKKVFERAGESTLIDMIVDGKESEKKVLIKDIQRDPVKGDLIHVDFYEVNMNEPINASIQLNFIGESNAIKNLGGSLIKDADEIEVKCLPGDLVNHIDVDISKLNELGDTIHIKDLNIPEGMEVAQDPDGMVAIVVEPKEEKEEEIPSPESVESETGGAKEDNKEGGEGEKKEEGKE